MNKIFKYERLADAELDIMRTLWQADAPLKAADIVKKLSSVRSWKTQTAHVLLNRLAEKSFINIDKSGYYHLYSPNINENEYFAYESEALAERLDGSVKKLVASLIDTSKITDNEILELSDIIERKKAEIERSKNK